MLFADNSLGTASQSTGTSQPATVARVNVAPFDVSYYMPKEPVRLP